MLWKKVMPRLSAGRVQSVATRLVVDRERQRMRFVAASYWDILGTFEPGSFEARLSAVDGKRVAQGRDFGEDGSPSAAVLVLAEDAGTSPRGRAGRAAVHRRERRREALHAATRGTVPHLHVAAGSEPQAPLLVPDDDASRSAPVRERPHHVHANRLRDAVGYRADGGACARGAGVRTGHGSCRAPALRARRCERAGGTRGHPARRRRLQNAGRAARRALARRARALRPHLQADRGVPDEGRERPDRLDRAGCHDRRRSGGDFPCKRHRDHVPRVSQGVRVGARRADRGRRGAPVAGADGRRDAASIRARATGSRDEPACALHGGEPREGAGGARYRPPVHVRLDHGDDPRPRLRLQEGHRARADVRRVLGDPAAREAFRPARRLRLHGAARGRSRPDRVRRRGTRRVAAALLLRRRQSRPPCARDRSSRGDRCAGRELDRDPRLRHRGPGGPIRAVPRARRAASEPARRPRAGRAHSCASRGAARPALGRRASARDRIRRQGERSQPRTAGTART